MNRQTALLFSGMMRAHSEHVAQQKLEPLASEQAYAHFLDDQKRRLIRPLLMTGREHLRSRAMWAPGHVPGDYQIRNLLQFLQRLPAMLLADDCGLDRTGSAGLIIAELLSRGKIARALVICSAASAVVWRQNLCDQFGITARFCKSADFDEERHESSAAVLLITPEVARTRLARLRDDEFGMVILDDAHRLGNFHDAPKIAETAERVREALAARIFKYLLLLSATPLPHWPWNFYSLVDLLSIANGRPNPFGTREQFAAAFLTGPGHKKLKTDREEEFRGIVSEYVVHTAREEAADELRARKVESIVCDPTDLEDRMIDLMASQLDRLNSAAHVAVGQAMMSSPQAFAAQLKSLAFRDLRFQPVAQSAAALAEKHLRTPKLQSLLKLIETHRDGNPSHWRLVIFTLRKETQTAIARALRADGIPVGLLRGGLAGENRRVAAAFADNPPGVNIVVSTDTGAEGMNLAASDVLVNYDLTWNPVTVEQRIARLSNGQPGQLPLKIYNLSVARSAEERVVGRLMEKLQSGSRTLGDADAMIHFATPQDEGSFEDILRRLVVESLRGESVDKATGAQAVSLQRARSAIEKHRTEIETLFPANLFAAHDLSSLLGSSDETNAPDTGAICVRDLSCRSEDQVAATARQWCKTVPGAEMSAAQIRSRSSRKQIAQACRAHLQNTLDELDLLVNLEPEEAENHPIDPSEMLAAPLLTDACDLPASDDASITDRVKADPAVSAFIRAYADRVSAADISLHINVVGASGFQYEVITANVTFTLDGKKSYSANVEMIPATGRIISEPARAVCAITGHLLPVVCLEKCQISGQSAASHRLITSAESARRALPNYGITCAISGRLVFADEVWESSLTGKKALAKYFSLSPQSNRRGLPEDFSRCQFTGLLLLSDELAISEISGKFYRLDQQARCTATGATGHSSELGECEETHAKIAPDQIGISAISGHRVLKMLLVHSEKSPHRLALTRESVVCAASGKTLLLDEVGTSVVSNRRVDLDLLQKSDLSGRLALGEEMLTCAATGQRLLPGETAVSDFSGKIARADLLEKSPVSGRAGLIDEFRKCKITGDEVLADELATSAQSRRKFRQDQSATSDESGRVAHISEMVICSSTGAKLLRKEAGESAITGATHSLKLLLPSGKSPERFALESELVICAISGKRLLPDELAQSAVSGKSADKDLLIPSDRSGKLALPDELILCAATGRRLLPTETALSDVSSIRVDSDLLRPSSISGRRGLATEFALCQITAAEVLSDELVLSDESGLAFRVDQAVKSDESGRVAHASETVVCSETGSLILRSESGTSAITGKIYSLKLLHPSEKAPYRIGVDAEFVTCSKTGKRLLLDEVDQSKVSGQTVDKDLLVPSALTRKLALPDELVECAATRRRVLPTEIITCAVTGLRVAAGKNLVGLSAVSGKPALLVRMLKCDATGKLALPGELVTCEATNKQVLPSELGICSISGKRVLKERLMTSALSGATFLTEYAIRSPLTGRVCAPKEGIICAWLWKKLPKDEVAECALTGLSIARPFLNENSELRSLRDLLDGKDPGTESPDLLPWLQDERGNLTVVKTITSPQGKIKAVCGEARSMLGLKVMCIGCVVSERRERVIAGNVATGWRRGGNWIASE